MSNAMTLRLPLILIASCLGACSSFVERTPDEFVLAAESWEGTQIQRMVQVWGPPEVIEEGSATWGWSAKGQQCETVNGYRINRYGNREQFTKQVCGHTNSYAYLCNVTASFDESQVITEVDAYSLRCTVAFKEAIPYLHRSFQSVDIVD